MHAIMSHSHAIAAADSTEFHGIAAGSVNSFFNGFCYLTKVGMTRNNLTKCICNANNRPGKVFVVIAQRFQNSCVVEFMALSRLGTFGTILLVIFHS